MFLLDSLYQAEIRWEKFVSLQIRQAGSEKKVSKIYINHELTIHQTHSLENDKMTLS